MRSLSFIALFLSLLLIALLLLALDPESALADRETICSAAIVIAVYLFVYSLTIMIRSRIKS